MSRKKPDVNVGAGFTPIPPHMVARPGLDDDFEHCWPRRRRSAMRSNTACYRDEELCSRFRLLHVFISLRICRYLTINFYTPCTPKYWYSRGRCWRATKEAACYCFIFLMLRCTDDDRAKELQLIKF